jgi:hypothetical protein
MKFSLLESSSGPFSFQCLFISYNFIAFQPISETTLGVAQDSFIDFLKRYQELFGVTAMTAKVHALQHVLDDCKTQDCHLDYNSVYDFESEQQQWGKGKIIRGGNKVLEQITCVPTISYII